MKNNKYLKSTITSVICTLAAAAVMIVFQTVSNNSVEEKLTDKLLTEIPEQLDSETEERKDMILEHDNAFQRDLAALRYLLETGGAQKCIDEIKEKGVGTSFFITGKDGIVTNGTEDGCKGKRLIDLCPLSPEEYHLLIETDGDVNTAVRETENGGLVKVYATGYGNARLVMPVSLKGNYASVYSLDGLSGIFGFVDERLLIVPIDNISQKIIALKTETLELGGQSISVLNLDESVTRQPSSGRSKALGYGFRYRTVQYKSDILGDLTILSVCVDNNAVPVGPLAILLVTILLVTFLLQLYCLYIDDETGKLQMRVGGLRSFGRKGHVLDTEKARVLLPFSLVCIVIVTIAGFYLSTLNIIGNQCWTSRWNIGQVSESLGKINKTALDNFDAETEDMGAFLQVTASLLEDQQGTLLNCRDVSRLKRVKYDGGAERTVEICNPWLAGLAKVESASDISVFDDEGRLISTSGTQRSLGWSRGNAASAVIFDVIDGVSTISRFQDGEYLVVAVPFSLQNNGNSTDAMMVSRFSTSAIQNISTTEFIKNTFEAASQTGHCHYIMASASDEHRPIYASEALASYAGNIPAVAFTDDYVGFHKVHGTKYFVATKLVEGNRSNYFILSFAPVGEVYARRATGTVTTFVVTLLVMFILLAVLLVYSPGKAEELKEQSCREMKAREALSSVQLEKLEVEQKKKPSPSQKIQKVIGNIWKVILLMMTLVLIRGLVTSPTETLSGYLMSFAWQRGVNVFSITTMLIVIMSFSFLLFALTKLMSVLGRALNAGAETVCQLLVSLLRYAGYIVAAFVTLFMFGVDTTGVLASLGAFSVMVGMGAKNLITDILAGISIIMEKDYRVGDIVNIGGFCGKVSEIGIRTTKVEDIDGNVKIFFNSGVNGVINMTSKPSAVRLDVKLDSKHSFEQAEKEFALFFEKVKNKYPQIKGDCTYLGVQDSTSAFNVYRIAIPCDEIDRAPLRRSLIKEFSEFCKDENINKL